MNAEPAISVVAIREKNRQLEAVHQAIRQAEYDARDRELKAIAVVMERLRVFEVLGPSEERPADFLRERAEDLVKAVLAVTRQS